MLSLFRELSAAAPLLVAVDDAQWLDRATAAALRFALRRLDTAPVGVLATVRVDGARTETFADAAPAERFAEIGLTPLSVAAIHEIVLRRLGHALPRPTVVKVVAASGGNPFYALEIARELVRMGRTSGAGRLPIPDESRALVRARLGRLSQTTRQALLVASCLSIPTTALVDEEALAPAEAAGVVRIEPDGRIRFVHPLLAAAVYEAAPMARRRAVHRELARRLADPEERARHLAFGVEQPDDEVAGQLDGAAWTARGRGAPAAELMELALGLTPEPAGAERARRLLSAAAFNFDAGDLARAQALLEQALGERPRGSQSAQALRLLGQLHSRRSSFADADELAVQALEAAGDDPSLQAAIELDLAFYRFSLGDLAGAEPHARAAVAQAEELEDDHALADSLAVLTMVEFLRGRGLAEGDLDRALALEDPRRAGPLVLRPRFIHGLVLLWTGWAQEALATLDAVRAETLEQGRESDVPLVFLYLVWACLWLGDLEQARRFAEESRETARLFDDRIANALTLSASALVHAHEGRTEAARAEAAQAISLFDQLQWQPGTIWARWALGFLELSLGNPAAVDAALGLLADQLAGLGPTDPVLGIFLPDEIEALIELGELVRAERLIELLERPGRTLDRPWALAVSARCTGLLHAARGDLEAALTSLDEALVHHDRAKMPFERARTLLALGRVLRRSRRRRQAREALTEALALFERSGTPLWASRAQDELRRLGLAASGHDRLTATERQIAELAAAGLTNREIAGRAFVTVKTVEARLTRVYRKLGIRSRPQLSRALDERASRPTP